MKPVDVNSYEVTKWTNAYLQKYNWKLNTIIDKKIQYLYMENYNGEKLYQNNLNEFNQIESRPIPKKIIIKWLDSEGSEKDRGTIIFDEEEIFKAYAELNIPGDQITIEPEINTKTYETSVRIKNSKKVILLKKIEFEIE